MNIGIGIDLCTNRRGIGSADPLLTGLVTDWQFENNLLDSGPNAQTLTAVGGTPTYVAAGSGNAVRLNGTVTLSRSNTEIGTVGLFTIAGWVRFTATGLATLWGLDGDRYQVFTRTNQVEMRTYNGVGFDNNTKAYTQASATWYCVTAWYDGAGTYIDINNSGSPAGLAATVANRADKLFTVGSNVAGFGNLNGDIARLRVWNRVLTVAERTLVYNGGIPG